MTGRLFMAKKDALDEKGVPKNIYTPIMKVKHAKLKTWDTDSLFKRICPKCKIGCLPVCRDLRSGRLQRVDRCMLCGQAVEYEDFDEVFAGVY